MKNFKEFSKQGFKTLKSMIDLYDSLSDNLSVCSSSDDVLESLSSSIFYLGCAICPPDCICFDDIRYFVKGH